MCEGKDQNFLRCFREEDKFTDTPINDIRAEGHTGNLHLYVYKC
jgi:hypothetical protein